MFEEFSHLPAKERIRAENEFLAMKLMAERGASISMSPSNDIKELAMQNLFLREAFRSGMAFQKMKVLPLGQAYGLAQLFRPLNSIPETERELAWKEMDMFLRSKSIHVEAVSPRVKASELYRFVLEELIHLHVGLNPPPGFVQHFIYDEFHPDMEFEACCIAMEGGLLPVLGDNPLPADRWFTEGPIWFNQQRLESADAYRDEVRLFQQQFERIITKNTEITRCEAGKDHCIVKGSYKAIFENAGETCIRQGEWMVTLYADPERATWRIGGVSVEGILFPQ